MSKLTIVLICSGNGADPSNYRPSRDDVRYRFRHDALVRCVAASLYGPVNINGSCELILLYSGDLSCMRMKLSTGSSQVVSSGVMPSPPLERDVVQSWKDAAKLAVRNRQLNDLQLVSSAGSIGTLNKEPVVTSVPSLRTVCVLDTTWKVVQTDTSTTVQQSSTHFK
eukprot:scaffold28900_cov93-Cyclotella_meneghiniana.AAC.22